MFSNIWKYLFLFNLRIQGGQEFEFLADQFGVVALIELVQSFFGDDAIKTLRIYDLDRVNIKILFYLF